MGYLERTLMEDEEIVYRAKLHWVLFLGHLLALLLGVVLLIVTMAAQLMVEEPRGLSWLYIFIGVLLLVVLALMIPKFLYRTSCEFAVTTRRVIVKTGLVRVCSFELLLGKIEGIHVDQSFLGRLLDYGTVSISATGGSKNTYERISKPLEFRTKIQQQADEAQHRSDQARD